MIILINPEKAQYLMLKKCHLINYQKSFQIYKYICMYQLISEMDLRKVERISKALSDPNRIKILQQIRKKKAECLYCNEISTISHLAQPSISHHIKQLVDADLVIAQKEGREMKYILNNAVLDEYTKFLETLKI